MNQIKVNVFLRVLLEEGMYFLHAFIYKSKVEVSMLCRGDSFSASLWAIWYSDEDRAGSLFLCAELTQV